jgi:glycolate oxidase FAD binding subunit
MEQKEALDRLNAWAGEPLPVSASVWHDDVLSVRLSGSEPAVTDARRRLGGELMDAQGADAFWAQIREQTHPFFAGAQPLWRVSVPSTSSPLELDEAQLIEWGGALRWVRSLREPHGIRALAQRRGGHATLFRGADPTCDAFTPLPAPLMAIHRRLKSHFDPAGIFNPGRLYRDL